MLTARPTPLGAVAVCTVIPTVTLHVTLRCVLLRPLPLLLLIASLCVILLLLLLLWTWDGEKITAEILFIPHQRNNQSQCSVEVLHTHTRAHARTQNKSAEQGAKRSKERRGARRRLSQGIVERGQEGHGPMGWWFIPTGRHS